MIQSENSNTMPVDADQGKNVSGTISNVDAQLTSPDSPDVHGWQPIETAPKDGSTIDLCCRNISQGSTGQVRASDMWWDDDVDRWVDRSGCILEPKWRPTHWMPLPAPPALP